MKLQKGFGTVAFGPPYISPLIRAKKTAEVIPSSRETPLIEDAAIKEMGFGVYEGMCISGEAKSAGGAEFNKFLPTLHILYLPEAESVEGLLARTGRIFTELCASKRIRRRRSCCPHTRRCDDGSGQPCQRGIWRRQISGKRGVPPNCAVTLVEVENKKPEIVF